MFHLTELSSSSKSIIRLIAQVIRDQLNRAREPENLRRLVGLSNELRNNANEVGRVFWWLPYEGDVGINNLYKAALHDHHFGYTGRVRFCESMLLLFVRRPC